MKNVIQFFQVLDPSLMNKPQEEQNETIGAAFTKVHHVHIHNVDDNEYYIMRIEYFDDTVLKKMNATEQDVKAILEDSKTLIPNQFYLC